MKLLEIEQKFIDEKMNNIKQTIQQEVKLNKHLTDLPKGSEVAITAGSRGISNIVEILREVVAVIKEMDLKPFVVPAMGSHGGATAEGQIKVLDHLGITEESMGAQIRSSMEVVQLGETESGLPVYMDKNAYGAKGIIVVNRIKAHTAFQGMVESGLSKMITIGLGKQKGASFAHSQGALKMADNIIEISRFTLQHAPITMGLAIIENGYDETADIVGVGRDEWFQKESELLKVSKEMMPSLPVDEVDLLIVEEMGKCFSGTGMDPNIIGRWRIEGVREPEKPQVNRIAVLDLAQKSFGNAQGVGLADFTTEELFKKIDRQATYMNALTSTYLQRAMIPLIYDSEKEMIQTAIQSLGPGVEQNSIKIVQIPNTLHLKTAYVSKAVIKEMERANRVFTIVGEHEVAYSENGRLEKRITNRSN